MTLRSLPADSSQLPTLNPSCLCIVGFCIVDASVVENLERVEKILEQVKPRRAPAFGPARHWRFAGGAFTPPLTKEMLTPPWNPSIGFPALDLLYVSVQLTRWHALTGAVMVESGRLVAL